MPGYIERQPFKKQLKTLVIGIRILFYTIQNDHHIATCNWRYFYSTYFNLFRTRYHAQLLSILLSYAYVTINLFINQTLLSMSFEAQLLKSYPAASFSVRAKDDLTLNFFCTKRLRETTKKLIIYPFLIFSCRWWIGSWSSVITSESRSTKSHFNAKRQKENDHIHIKIRKFTFMMK